MLSLDKLSIKGFKSFVEPTDFEIKNGLTGIVGPNGCGKSNIVEAIRFGLGEVSAKQLRGKEIDDLIFNGTDNRPSWNIAEVGLFVNIDGSDLENKFQFNLSYVSQNNLGPGSARNNGVKNSKGELIVFIDSDCEADSNWLEIIFNAYKKNEFDAFGGPDEARDDFLPIQIAINFSMTSFLTTGGIRGHNKNMISKFFPRSHNMGVKKTLFET